MPSTRSSRRSSRSSAHHSDAEEPAIRENEPRYIWWGSIMLLGALITMGVSVVMPIVKERIEFPPKVPSLSEFLLEASLNHYLPKSDFADEIIGNITAIIRPSRIKSEYGDLSSPGMKLRQQGAKAHFPVLMIPGIISTGLELWEGEECARPYFRERLWGTLTMLRFLFMDSKCWLKHLRLDEKDGGDPPGIKIRPAQGLEAADFLMPGFWVWARIIENLAEIGYEHKNLQMAPYDWRLSVEMLEKRDRYFTRLKNQIELMKEINGKKIVVLTHSLGATIWLYFMKWVESDVKGEHFSGGNGGKSWVNDHISSVVNIGGTFLGAPKSLSTIVSGESRETAMLGRIETYILELMLSKAERVDLFRTWTGGLAILPKGGNLIWGGKEKAAKDFNFNGRTVPFLSRSRNGESLKEFYADDVELLCDEYFSEDGAAQVKGLYSNGIAKSDREIEENEHDRRTWVNPLKSRLPIAPDLTIYCFHGVGKGTERGYVYKSAQGSKNIDMVIDLEINGNTDNQLSKGVFKCDGDGTVPLLSLGYMAVKGWRKYSGLNPARIPIVIREYKDDVSDLKVTDVRGGPKSGDHVDILGNYDLTMDILRIAADFHEAASEKVLDDRIISDIVEISADIDLPLTPK